MFALKYLFLSAYFSIKNEPSMIKPPLGTKNYDDLINGKEHLTDKKQ